MTKSALILVAAGIGARAMGLDDHKRPKQYRFIAGKPLLRWTLDAALTSAHFDVIVIVHAKDDDFIQEAIGGAIPFLSDDDITHNRPDLILTLGGDSRTASVMAGMKALQDIAPDLVFIHDAARPFLTSGLMQRIFTALETHPSAIPALPVIDALKSSDGHSVSRANLHRVQTPQGFHYAPLMAAYNTLKPNESFDDDVAVAHASAMHIHFVTGDETNFKVTYPQDFKKAETMLQSQTYTATGSGYDVHRYTDGDGIWLCGIKIPAPYSLLGHSDADAGLHALTDAIFGALADGDIGDHFPPSDPQWKNAASDQFLAYAVNKIKQRGGWLQHVDVTLVCEKPKIKPHRGAMQARIAEICNLPIRRVSVKATTTEKLGFTGREEGLAAQAVATIRLPDSL